VGNVVIRAARTDDAPDLLEIQRQVIEENVANVDDQLDSLEQWQERIRSASKEVLWLVADAENRAIGLLQLLAPAPRFLRHIRNLYIEVHRDWRGSGVGAALIQHGAEWARQNGVELIALSVLDSNPRARSLYERLGFEVTGHTSRLVKRPDGSMADDTQMILDLTVHVS
jgi:ribosomal protein S18 acetylase RimI-like enzyme